MTNEILTLLETFAEIAASPGKQLQAYLNQGKKVIACFPYYAPEEIIAASGMVPFGLWGKRGTVKAAREYFPAFYCSLAQMGLEMVLDGTLEGVSGILCTTLCDTLRPLTQNLKAACKVPVLFLAHPQNRREPYGIAYTKAQYEKIRKQTEEIAGRSVTEDDLRAAIHEYNENRKACRQFARLCGLHPQTVSATARNAVFKARYFMEKREHTRLLVQLNQCLEGLEVQPWKGVKVVTSGIILDHPALLALLDENRIAIVADDVAQESRGIRHDADESIEPVTALARQFALQDEDPILYDPDLNKRPAYIVKMVKESGAQGVIVGMMSFCDPEEMEYPSLKAALDQAGIPSVMLGYEHQMTDFGQAATSLQAFVDLL